MPEFCLSNFYAVEQKESKTKKPSDKDRKAAEVEKVIALNNYSDVYDQLRDKLEYNRNRAIEIALDGQGPSLITEFDFHEYDRYLNITRGH
mgnify:CR=1 FL=1